MAYQNPQYLVECEWLEQHLDDPNLRIIDCHVDIKPSLIGKPKFHPGRKAWQKAHIPGADFVDFNQELSDPISELELMLPSAHRFSAVMQSHGVRQGDRLVLYDSQMNTWAARLWWMLRHYGFENAAVLNGGMRKWRAEGRPLSAKTPHVPRGDFVARPAAKPLFADKDEVLDAVNNGGACILDALAPEVYSGAKTLGVRRGRAGHIPTAANVPFASVVDPQTHAFLPAEQLSQQFDDSGAQSGGRVITYCGAGIAASSVAFALALLGCENIAVYDGSMFEWAADPDLPLEISS
jgi:thiosulfate/3-mercaptopyruvate sulfurtransferase